MSDEERKDEETEVEGHAFPPKYGVSDEPAEDDENEFELHIKFPNARMD
jgi:hypothetical protein